MKKISLFVSVVLLGLVLGLFLQQILYGRPSEVPSALLGKKIPDFSIPDLYSKSDFFSQQDLISDEKKIVNIWASWCVPCRAGHPFLVQLQKDYNIKIYGINYKDSPEKAKAFLEKYGNPFVKTGADEKGYVGILWGIFGVPETFVIDKDGTILYKHLGPLTEETLQQKILPLFSKVN